MQLWTAGQAPHLQHPSNEWSQGHWYPAIWAVCLPEHITLCSDCATHTKGNPCQLDCCNCAQGTEAHKSHAVNISNAAEGMSTIALIAYQAVNMQISHPCFECHDQPDPCVNHVGRAQPQYAGLSIDRSPDRQHRHVRKAYTPGNPMQCLV